MKWSAVVLTGLFIAAMTAMVAKEPVSADAGAPRVTRIGAMSVERAAHQATLLQTGQVLVTGGCAGRGCASLHASAELYDPATRSFRAAAPMAVPRASHATAALPDGRVLVAGGWTGQRATVGAAVYNSATGEWTERAR